MTPEEAISWEVFNERFQKRFIPPEYIDRKKQKFTQFEARDKCQRMNIIGGLQTCLATVLRLLPIQWKCFVVSSWELVRNGIQWPLLLLMLLARSSMRFCYGLRTRENMSSDSEEEEGKRWQSEEV